MILRIVVRTSLPFMMSGAWTSTTVQMFDELL
jgi:hypothetical protein